MFTWYGRADDKHVVSHRLELVRLKEVVHLGIGASRL